MIFEGRASGAAVLAGIRFKCGGNARAIRSSVLGLRCCCCVATISAIGIPIICPLESDDTVESSLAGRTRWTDVEVLAAVTVAIVSVGNEDGAGLAESSGDATSVLASFRLFSTRSEEAGRLVFERRRRLVEFSDAMDDNVEALGFRSDIG